MQANVSKLNYLVALTLPLFAFCTAESAESIVRSAHAAIAADYPEISLELFAASVILRHDAMVESARQRLQARSIAAQAVAA